VPTPPRSWSNRARSIGFGLFLLLLLFLTGALVYCPAGERGVPAQNGIGNFGIVSERLYRGAQPDEKAMERLKELGIKLIINLRMPGDVWKQEAALAAAHGILYTNLPWRGLGAPTEAQVRLALALVEAAPGPVFVHCEHGCDRTGTVIACYRVQHDQWPHDAALEEARHYGLSRWERGMKRFILAFQTAKQP